ncbi:MAG: site-2 protease family protein [Chlamydiales bacterium]
MAHSIFYLILAGFGLGFLVFIHELGHYFMARRVGMTIEAFSIGFGKPILSWEHKGVKWQVGWLPLGGFVRIKGMEKKGAVEPYQIPDGFFGKTPWQRIQVAIMGPVANIIFALVAFSLIWVTGGREKPFAEFTHLIGWVDTCSKLYENGVRAGDEITAYNGRPFQGFKDIIYAGFTDKDTATLQGEKIDYTTLTREPFNYTLHPYPSPLSPDPSFKTIGVLGPASVLLFDQARSESQKPGAPLYQSGIQDKDRIVWIDGELVFSLTQFITLLNEQKTLLTVKRGDKVFLTRIPREKVADIKFSNPERAELDDWQHEAAVKNRIDQLFFVPYAFAHDASVIRAATYLDDNSKECNYADRARSPIEIPLVPGDKVVAVDGVHINSSVELLKAVQKRQVRLIVERFNELPVISWKNVDRFFLENVQWDTLEKIIHSLGTEKEVQHAGNFFLLSPVTPVAMNEFPLNPGQRTHVEDKENAIKKQIASIENPKAKAEAARFFDQKKLKLGMAPLDLHVRYNPSPFTLFSDAFKETCRTLTSLFSGALSPKWMTGPVGIVQVIHQSWAHGVKEALFWMGLISLNLAFFNLLPIPVLDGGHILFSAVEVVTKKPIKAKTMERLIVPFIVLLIALFVYLTYNDLHRLLSHFFK